MWRTWTKKRYVCTSCLYKSLTFQGCRKLFSGFFMSNNVGHHGWPTEKKTKKLAKTPKNNPPKMKRSIYTFQWTSSEFFLYFRFSSGKSHCQQKLSLRVTYFTINFAQNTSLILWMSTHLTLKIICSRNTVKDLFYFTDFSSNVLLFDARKNICTGPFLDIQELHS